MTITIEPGITIGQGISIGKILPYPPPVIGQEFGGGFYAGAISTTGDGIADYYLVVGPASSADTAVQWKTSNTTTVGTNSNINGPSNSTAMNNALHPAAQFCESLIINGFSDWYLPARNELEICYYNLKPGTLVNSTVPGVNPNAVPPRTSPYTTVNPAQTSLAAFQAGGDQAFTITSYWTSTENSSTTAWAQSFNNGAQSTPAKSLVVRVRAVRRVAI